MHSGRIAPPLSPEERALFDNFGYLLLRGFLPRDAVRWLLEIVDRVCEAERVRQGLGLQDFVEVRNAVAKDHELLALVDWPEMLSIITELMGVELQLNTSHAMVRPPQPPDTPESFKAIAWHRDGHQNIPVV
ncbi:MAG TPA: hypothetical protein VGJ84_18005, partial [Polyangiaceae bacterium]